MRAAIYSYWRTLPGKIGMGAIGIGGIAAQLDSKKANSWIAWLMTPEQVHFWGAVAIAVSVAYWVILYLLKPKIKPAVSPGSQQTARDNARQYAAARDLYVQEGVAESDTLAKLRDTLAQRQLDRLAAEEERDRQELEAIRRSREWQQTTYRNMHVPQPDTPVAEAIVFLELGYWGGVIANLYDYEPERRKLAYKRFETFAKLGKLTIWGTLQGTNERKIPAGAWRTFELDEEAMEINEARTSPRGGKTPSVGFSDLMASRIQLEYLRAQNDRA